VGGGIPYLQFRHVLSARLTAIAAFFAFACYDETSINKAFALLQKKMDCGDVLKDKEKLFPEGLESLVGDQDVKYNYLFSSKIEEGCTIFITNVVVELNRLGECLNAHATYRPGRSKPLLVTRIQSHLFRTMCSDMVEILVSHGCYPVCHKSIFDCHPGLQKMINAHFSRKSKERMYPVPILIEYIILLIAEGKVRVRSSHYYVVNNLLPFDTKPSKSRKSSVTCV
jgi:hypothetical protein